MSTDILYTSKTSPVVDAPWLNAVNRYVNDTFLPTVASLRGIVYNPATSVTRAFLLGNLVMGDGGGGLYWRDATDTTTSDNGITVVVGSDGSRWKKFNNQSLSVADFGVVADGNYNTGAGTDQRAKLQAAINLLSVNGGGFLDLPAGPLGAPFAAIKLNSPITIPDGVFLRGKGKWSTIFFAPNSFADTGGLIQLNGPGGNPAGISSVGILAQFGGAPGYGCVSTKNGAFVRDVWVNGWGLGVQLSSTDNFFQDFVVELCTTNVFVTQTHVHVADGEVYRGGQGVIVSNSGSVEDGRVHITGVRATECALNGFGVAQGKGVILAGCSAASFSNSFLTQAAVIIDTSHDVVVEGFSAKITGTASTVGHGVKLLNASNDIVLSGVKVSGFLDGLNMAAGTGVTINGGQYKANGRHGLNLQGGDQISVTGVNACGNGLANAGSSGILSNNTATTASHSLVGNVCTQAGGSPQAYGINATLVDNGGATGTTLIDGNTCAFNGTQDIIVAGAVKNIVLGTNIPRGAVGSGVLTSVTGTTYSVGLAEEAIVFNASGNATVTLPPPSVNAGRAITLRTIAAHTVISASANVIPLVGGSAATGILAATAGKFAKLVCDGTAWHIMEAN